MSGQRYRNSADLRSGHALPQQIAAVDIAAVGAQSIAEALRESSTLRQLQLPQRRVLAQRVRDGLLVRGCDRVAAQVLQRRTGDPPELGAAVLQLPWTSFGVAPMLPWCCAGAALLR